MSAYCNIVCYIMLEQLGSLGNDRSPDPPWCYIRKGTNGVSTNGVTANFRFSTEGPLGYSR